MIKAYAFFNVPSIMKRKILFVISDPQESQDIAHLLGSARTLWDVTYARTGYECLKCLEEGACDVVVCEMRLPDRDGVDLLNEVLAKYPATTRIVLADLEERQTVAKCLGAAHQVLAKPYDAKRLKSALTRALETDAWTPGETARRLISQMTRLPSPPYIYFRVMRELRMFEPSLDNIGALISRDPVMSAKLLHAANSAALGLGMSVVNPAEAVMYLGLETTQALVLLSHTCSFYEQIEAPLFSVEQIWAHSIRAGQLAKKIAQSRKEEGALLEECFTAGLLHDMGKLILAANSPKQYREAMQLARAQNIPENDAERQVLGADHAEVGGCLLAGWGLPWLIVEAVAMHHEPRVNGKPEFSPLAAVHAANCLEHQVAGSSKPPAMDLNYLAAAGLSGELDKWKALAG
jgi:HD-like signal output (HDOD) protein/CheY-like chemotaxis protein